MCSFYFLILHHYMGLTAERRQVRPGDCLRQGSVPLKLMFCRSQGERLHRKLIFYVIQGEAFPLNNII